MKILFVIFGIAVFVAGVLLRIRLHKFEFENRNQSGLVTFDDYDSSLMHKLMKSMAAVAMIGGAGLVIYALIT